MESIQIDILNPKAKKLLKSLVDLNLIRIKKENDSNEFKTLLKKLRQKTKGKISLEEITEEVEAVRKKRNENL